MKTKQVLPLITTLVLVVTLFGTLPAAAAPKNISLQAAQGPKPKFSDNVAFDISPTLRRRPPARAGCRQNYTSPSGGRPGGDQRGAWTGSDRQRILSRYCSPK